MTCLLLVSFPLVLFRPFTCESHHVLTFLTRVVRRLSPPLLASKATFDRLPQVVCCLCSNLNSWLVACFDRRVVCTLLKRGSWRRGEEVREVRVRDSPSNMPKCNTLHAQFYTNSYTYYERSQLFFFRSREDYDRSAPSASRRCTRVSPLACAPFTGSARTELIRTFAPFTRPAPHKFSQPNRLTLHPATNRNQSDIHTRPAPVWT